MKGCLDGHGTMDDFPYAPPEDLARFMEKVVKRGDGSGCWEWVGRTIVDGYGRFKLKGRNWLVHRLAYLWKVGELPEFVQTGNRIEIDHLCRNRLCVNTSHLEIVTHKVNSLRGIGVGAKNLLKIQCPKGHPYDEKNTMVTAQGRVCKICNKKSNERYKQKLLADPERLNKYREKQRQRTRELYRKNPQYRREWARKNREHVNEYMRQWRAKRKLEKKK